MTDIDIQDSLIKSIQLLAGDKINSLNFTKSFSGRVVKIEETSCLVDAHGQSYDCIIPTNLLNHVSVEEIVVVQDLQGNNQRRIVQGVISSLGSEIHVYDPIQDEIISSKLSLWNEGSGEEVFGIVLEIE